MKHKILLALALLLLTQSASAECIELPDLMDYISEWKQGNIDLVVLIEKISDWKSGAGCEPVSGLVSHWKFDDAFSDGIANDSGTGENDGLISGATQINDEDRGLVASFDGVGDYIEIKTSNNLDFSSQNLTISAWIKVTGSTVNSANRVIRIGEQITFGVSESNNELGGYVYDGGWQGGWDESNYVITENVWHHVVMVMNGSKNYYVDGHVVANVGSGYEIDGSADVTRIGSWTGESSPNHPFKGLIDDVMIFNRALSENEIQGLAETECRSDSDCNDNTACTVDSCVGIGQSGADGRGCSYSNKSQGTSCEGMFYCTSGDICDGLGNCQPGSPISCEDSACIDDKIDCTVETCNESTDSWNSVPNDNLCTNPLFPNCNPVLGCVEVGAGKVYYCDPINGNTATGDGSKEKPWGTLQSVFEAAKITQFYGPSREQKHPNAVVLEGDTIKLLTGYHGKLNDDTAGYHTGYRNSEYITIEAAEGHNPTMAGIYVNSWTYWRFKGIEFSRELSGELTGAKIFHMGNHSSHGDCHHIILEDCTMKTAEDSTVSPWTAQDWDGKAGDGIHLEGKNHVIRNNNIKNVANGIVSGGENSLIEHNKVNKFVEDGLKMTLGENQVWQYNDVRNSLNVNSNHDDLIQCWVTGSIANTKIMNNTFIACDDPSIPYCSSAQGIFLNGGTVENCLIVNNLVISSHAHGIKLESPQDCDIENNTLARPAYSPDDFGPVIHFDSDSGPPNNNVVRGNISWGSQGSGTNLLQEKNVDLGSMSESQEIFVDYESYDFRPVMDSPACDGTVHEPGVAIGALPCVCTSDSQCETVLGPGHACTGDAENPGECA